MSLTANMKRPITFVGGIAGLCLFSGVIMLVVTAVDVVTGTPIDWLNLGVACFQIWMFTSIWARGGIFKDARAKPAQ